ncbi:acid protease [Laetiporus sulphureus 93-53]|uniref:Acid protease n=1 Tax=Laetiporus sulphureus 93-53 TaxID=1314785 RepID=A0A165GWH3_9APHY|nr:acid protease [Laetiporus sulphureus 93-53]KZT10921.1 acid protease [Laetiporus sulphureus 93-53]
MLLPSRYPLSPANVTQSGTGILNNQDSSYLGILGVGTPSQSFPLIMDTGSSDLWLASTSCSGCPSGTPEYSSSSSSTYKANTTNSTTGQAKQVEIQYGSGAVEGTLASDTISMGGLSVDSQTFLLVNEVSSALLGGNVTGILGLAFQSLASTGAVPFWQALISNGQLSSPEFAFYLARFLDDTSAASEEPGGTFTLGGTNSSLYSGDIEYHDLADSSQETYWLLTISNMTVQGSSVDLGTSLNAAIDTGTTLIGGPQSAVENIYAEITGSTALEGDYEGYYSFPCSTTVNVTLSFGGKEWPINSADMNLGVVSGDSCLGGVFILSEGSDVSGSSDPTWVVGDTFLKNVYTVFRSSPASVGFAELSTSAGGPEKSASITTSGLTTPTSSGGSSSSTSSSSTSSSSSAVEFANARALTLGVLFSLFISTLSGWTILA